jgi:hypothetical protein
MQIAIASSAAEFNEAPGQYRGFIERRAKRQLDLTVDGYTYTMTTRGLLVSRLPLENGKNWYSFLSSDRELFDSMSAEKGWVLSYAVSRDAKGLIFK